MAEILTDVVTNLAPRLVNQVTKEAQYLCCFKSYVEDFEEEKKNLSATRNRVLKDIEEARERNEIEIEDEVKLWLEKAESLIQEDTKVKKKWFLGLCSNCYWQQQRGKELGRKIHEIPKLIEESRNFARVARSAGLPGIEFHSSLDFIHFESRKSIFEAVKEALRDKDTYMIGLQGMGGTGKTFMAIEVGKEVQQSRLFDKVIFTTVSNSPVVKNIQGDIARHLNFPLHEQEETKVHAEKLWSRIANAEENVLIILDDIWDKELNLKDIGIPIGQHRKGCCNVLLTTRSESVCKAMKCHRTIQLELLSKEDALNLLLFHADKGGDDSYNDFKDVALDIVEECGRLPVAVVVVAKALYSKPLKQWDATLIRLKYSKPSRHEDDYNTKVYNSLRLSYDNLRKKEAQELFLICSLFPEDYDISIEFFNRIAIGLGLCGEVEKYYIARSKVFEIQDELLDSCLLLKAKEDCVKIHDLVREVAHLIASTKIQVIVDSKKTLKESIQYSSWNIDCFPNCFYSTKLEFLLVWWVNANDRVEAPDGLFNGMVELRVLLLINRKPYSQTNVPSLFQSILSLRNIRTLMLDNWVLGDISIVRNLRYLETFELSKCVIAELPNEVTELENLKLLGLRRCYIRQNDPFKVITRCLGLEELYYVDNGDKIFKGNKDDELQQNITLPQWKRYHIVSRYSVGMRKADASISRCFAPGFSMNIFSQETVKILVARTEVLQLIEPNETRGKNLIPDIVRMEDGGMKDLISLSLISWSEIECLINTRHLQSDVTIFFKLVELELKNVNLKELCRGPFPHDFLKRLERVCLDNCLKLESTLFKDKLDLGKLKSIYLRNCSVTSLFHPSTARSLKQLEKLDIICCSQLEYIITKDDKDDPSLKGQGTMLPKLEVLYVKLCEKLEFILPICFVQDLPLLDGVTIHSCKKLKYVFGQYTYESSLSQKENEITLPSLTELIISDMPINIYPEWYHLKTYVMQGSTTISGDGLKANLADRIGSEAEKECDFNIAKCLLRPPLNPRNLRRVGISGCSNLTSLFTMHIASLMSSLEELKVRSCDELKYIIAKDGAGKEKVEDHHHPNHKSLGPMLPKLKRLSVQRCGKLEYVLPISLIEDLLLLEEVTVGGCVELKYIYGQYYPGEGGLHQNEKEITLLSALTDLTIFGVPNFMGIIPEWYHPMSSVVPPEYSSTTTTDANTASNGSKKKCDFNVEKCLLRPPLNPRNLRRVGISECSYLTSLFTMHIASLMSSLEDLEVELCHELKQIIAKDGAGEEKVEDHHQHNLCPMLPKLKYLSVERCEKLEYVLPISLVEDFPVLEELRVRECVELKYIYGQYLGEGGLHQKEKQITLLSALTKLTVIYVPNLMGLIPEWYHPTSSVVPEYLSTTTIDVNTALEVSKNILSLENLSKLAILGCKKLKVIFSTSILRSLPKLKELRVKHCEELENIVEENEQNLVHSNQVCFPQLSSIEIYNCKSLKCLFSVSKCDNLPNLEKLIIEDAPELVQVFGCEQGEIQHLVMKDVLPQLILLRLTNLQSLESFCQGIDFQKSEGYEVNNCPKFSSETDTHLQAASPERDQPPSQSKIKATNEVERDLEIQEQSNSSPHSTKEKLVDEEVKTQANIMDQEAPEKPRPDMHSNDSENNIEVISAIEGPSSKKYFEAISPTHSEPKESMGDHEAIRQSKNTNKASQGDNKSLDDAQKVKEPIGECSSKETSSNKTALTIPSAIAKVKELAFNPVVTSLFIGLLILLLIVIGNPLISSISTLKKSQIETSSTQKEMGSLQQNASEISTNTTIPWDKTLVNQTESYVDEEIKFDHTYSQQFQEDELIGLFQTMEKGANIGVHMPYVSKNDTLEDGKKVAKAFADLVASFEMSLSEIASSKEKSLRLENAINFLYTHFSKDRAHSLYHDHKATIDSMHQQIQIILSSFKIASATIHTINELEEKEKYINEELPRRKEAAISLISEISKTENSVAVAQQKKEELKEQISMLQAELNNKQKAIKDYNIKFSFLQEQKKKHVLDTIRFMKEFEALKKDKSHMMEDQIKAREELEKVEFKWSTCLANLKKTKLLLGTHLKQKL